VESDVKVFTAFFAAKHHKFGKAKQYGRKRGAKSSTDENKGEDGPPSSKQGKED